MSQQELELSAYARARIRMALAEIGRLRERNERLRAALKPFADEVERTPGGFSLKTDRKRANPMDLIRARRVYDGDAVEQSPPFLTEDGNLPSECCNGLKQAECDMVPDRDCKYGKSVKGE